MTRALRVVRVVAEKLGKARVQAEKEEMALSGIVVYPKTLRVVPTGRVKTVCVRWTRFVVKARGTVSAPARPRSTVGRCVIVGAAKRAKAARPVKPVRLVRPVRPVKVAKVAEKETAVRPTKPWGASLPIVRRAFVGWTRFVVNLLGTLSARGRLLTSVRRIVPAD